MFLNLFLDHAAKTKKPYKWANSYNNLEAFLLAYADDIVFYANNHEDMQQLLNSFEQFLNFYGFRVGYKKCAQQYINTKQTITPKLKKFNKNKSPFFRRNARTSILATSWQSHSTRPMLVKC